MALYDIIHSADGTTRSVATRIAAELERLFELHQFEFFHDVDECVDDSGDWLIGTLESRRYGVTINLYVHGTDTTLKAHIETDTDQWWAGGLTSFEDITDVVIDAVDHTDQTQATLTTE